MLVDDNILLPTKLRSGRRHRAGQCEQFLCCQKSGASNQERSNFHIGVTIVDQIIDDGLNLPRIQSVSLNLGANGIEAGWQRGGGDAYERALRLVQAAKCRSGEAEFIRTHDSVVVSYQQGCEKRLVSAT